MGAKVVAWPRGVPGPGQSSYRSTQPVCGDTADRLAPSSLQVFVLPAFSANALTSPSYVEPAGPACRLQSRSVGDAG